MKRFNPLYLLFGILLITGCRQEDPDGFYYPFQNHTWERFNILKFDIPVTESSKPYRVVLFARHNSEFPYTSLDFNMIMNTPSGEERIREFQLRVRDEDENWTGDCHLEICEVSVTLNNELYISKEGLLVIEIENLIPRMQTPGLLGIGIRLQQE